MPNITQIPAPRVPLIETNTGLMTTQWFRYFNNINTIVGGGTGLTPTTSGGTGTGVAPLNGQILIGNSTGAYTVAYLTASTGLFQTPGDGSLAVGLSNTTVTAGAYGSASAVSTFTVNPQGQLTSAASTSISISTSQITSGLLAIARGGTNGSATPTSGAISYGTGTAYAFSAAGTTSQILLSGGASSPTWANQSSLAVGTATNIAGGATGSLPYQVSSGSTTFLAPGSNGQVLTLTAGVPSWSTPSGGTVSSVSFTGGLITVANATTTPALTVAGTSGGVVYFSSASTWASSAALTLNSLMIGGGAGAAPTTTATGTGVLTALGTNIGTAGSFVLNGGALGTPSSGTVTNLTGTASININGTVGATTPSTGVFTTLTDSGLTAGRINYNGTGGLLVDSANLTFDGTTVTLYGQLTLTKATNYNLYASGAGANYMVGALNLGAINSSTNFSLAISGGLTKGAGPQYLLVQPQIQSDATGATYLISTYGTTAAASFTSANLYHFGAVQGPIGAGSTVTNQYGYHVNANLTGATNNYGFYSNIASGTNRFNFYAADTAQNVFVGQTSLGGNVGSESLRATPTASAVNYVNVIGAITTASPAIQAAGSDTNIDLVLTPKGTGVLSFGTYTAGVVAQTGYITIKDAGGTTRRLLVG